MIALPCVLTLEQAFELIVIHTRFKLTGLQGCAQDCNDQTSPRPDQFVAKGSQRLAKCVPPKNATLCTTTPAEGSDDDLAERVVFDGIARTISRFVGATQLLADLMKVSLRVDHFRVKPEATRIFCNAIHHTDPVFVPSSEFAVLFRCIADGEQYDVGDLRGFNRRHHVVRTGVIFAVAED